MIKPGTNVCVRYLAERSCVWFSWLWKLHYNLQKGWQGERWSFPGSVLLMMTGTGSWTASPSFISCLFLWSLERHITLWPTCWFFGDTCYDNTSLPRLDTQSCCPVENIYLEAVVFSSPPWRPCSRSVTSPRWLLLYIWGTNGMMPFFPRANSICAFTLAHCWLAFSVREYITGLCVRVYKY